MADSVTLAAAKREGSGTKAAVRLRKQGRVPAVVYGHKEATVAVSLARDELLAALRHGARVVDLTTDGSAETALIREVQWDHLGKEVLHVDFARVGKDERIHVEVRIELRGTAPGIAAGGVLDQSLHALEVECLAIRIPESIRVNVGELQIDGAIHVRDLHLPEGVVALTDADAVVVHVTAKQAEPEAAVAAPAAGGAEPEVIGRKAGEEEGEEEK